MGQKGAQDWPASKLLCYQQILDQPATTKNLQTPYDYKNQIFYFKSHNWKVFAYFKVNRRFNSRHICNYKFQTKTKTKFVVHESTALHHQFHYFDLTKRVYSVQFAAGAPWKVLVWNFPILLVDQRPPITGGAGVPLIIWFILCTRWIRWMGDTTCWFISCISSISCICSSINCTSSISSISCTSSISSISYISSIICFRSNTYISSISSCRSSRWISSKSNLRNISISSSRWCTRSTESFPCLLELSLSENCLEHTGFLNKR